MKNVDSDKFLSNISQINWIQLGDFSDNVSTAVNNFIYYQRSSRNMLQYGLSARSRNKLKSAAMKHKSSILISCYRQVRSKVNNLNKKLKKDYFSTKVASFTGNLQESWKTINQLLNRKSEITNIDNVKVESRDIKNPLEIVYAMSDYFCSVVENFPNKIKPQPNPLLSNEYTIVENTTRFEFVAINTVAAKKNLSKMKNSFGLDLTTLLAISKILHFQLFHNLYVIVSIFLSIPLCSLTDGKPHK